MSAGCGPGGARPQPPRTVRVRSGCPSRGWCARVARESVARAATRAGRGAPLVLVERHLPEAPTRQVRVLAHDAIDRVAQHCGQRERHAAARDGISNRRQLVQRPVRIAEGAAAAGHPTLGRLGVLQREALQPAADIVRAPTAPHALGVHGRAAAAWHVQVGRRWLARRRRAHRLRGNEASRRRRVALSWQKDN